MLEMRPRWTTDPASNTVRSSAVGLVDEHVFCGGPKDHLLAPSGRHARLDPALDFAFLPN